MVEFDKKGNPTISISKKNVVMLSTGEEALPVIKPNKEYDVKSIGSFKSIPWYDNDDFPNTVDTIISETPVLKRALTDITKITLGQGVFPCRVTGYNGEQEILEVINDPEIFKQLQSYKTRRYLAKTDYDLNAYGSAFVQFIPNLEGTKILTLNPVSALKCRLHQEDKEGKTTHVLVSGKWPDATDKDTKKYVLLDETDPFGHLTRIKENNELKGQTVFMHLKNSFSSNDFYPLPNWYAAKNWVGISQKIPKIIEAGIDNILNIFFLIRIPISYWEAKYPKDEYESDAERKAKITADIQKLEDSFTSVENARKALITHFGHDEMNGEDKWEIEIVQPKFNQENVINSNAADTQIAISANISPDLLGLMFGNSKGGSMQRELLLLHYALSWERRQQIADPIEMMLKFNLSGMEDLQLRFRNTFLTTLDTGAGTAKNLS